MKQIFLTKLTSSISTSIKTNTYKIWWNFEGMQWYRRFQLQRGWIYMVDARQGNSSNYFFGKKH